jgi:diaminopropionate ammonia-lyase
MSQNSEMNSWKYTNVISNKNFDFNRENILKILPKELIEDAYKVISNWEKYDPTPLLNLNKLNKKLNLNNIFYKDESKRFGLKSFKALGGAYAVIMEDLLLGDLKDWD